MTPPDLRVPDETLALVVIITGVLTLTGSAALQVVWLVAMALAAGAGLARREADARADGDGPTDAPP